MSGLYSASLAPYITKLLSVEFLSQHFKSSQRGSGMTEGDSYPASCYNPTPTHPPPPQKKVGKNITTATKARHITEKKRIIHWLSVTTSGSNSSLGLFYSINLCPEIKNLEETPYYGQERIFFSLGQKRGSAIMFFT